MSQNRRIVQMLPTIAYGDAIGNHVLALDRLFKKNGIDTDIYARNIDARITDINVKKIEKFKDDADIILYHLSTGDDLNLKIRDYKSRIVINYHNVTPENYFRGYDEISRKLCADGLDQVKMLSGVPEAVICDSVFNMNDLKSYGYECPMEAIPILIAFDDYSKAQNKEILERYRGDGHVNIVFTGRIAPNKKQEDVIRAFYYYHEYINPKSRLFIVGSYRDTDVYYRKLFKYVKKLHLEDVCFTGHIRFDEILAYYGIADVFLCMSEHEGFCVPLVEGMIFEKPVFAYACSAVPETLGNAGVLIYDKSPKNIATVIHDVLKDKNKLAELSKGRKKRLEELSCQKLLEQLKQDMEEIIELKKQQL